ncbi:MAG: hypothetical protein IJZ79_03545 [Bacilli bacterium]|nr:hypothetical protein [Bacilli bacterium]MBQ8218803.1 hypothetical protein [Bacilli bacterium]
MNKDEIKELAKKYCQMKDEIEQIHDKLESELFDKFIEVLKWKNENLGTAFDIDDARTQYWFTSEFYEDNMQVDVERHWSYGGHDTDFWNISYDMLLSDDWKEAALAQYKLEQEEKQKKQVSDEEEKELAELRRLSEKYKDKI